MRLSRQNVKSISIAGVTVPDENIFSLPEKVLQFGTGVLLRGLPDYFIDKANRRGVFNGRIVVVKSTGNGDIGEFEKQDNLYTLCVRGIEDNRETEEFIINSSISRVLFAKENWNDVLQCAHNAELKIIISNTTEIGIVFSEDNIHSSPPPSFPGKLLSFLSERYSAFGGTNESGMIIIPTELITDNGAKLRSIVLELAKWNQLDAAFIHWLETANHFCNSLVDRIVPGGLSKDVQSDFEKQLGYKDQLMIMAEPFRLWAIESGDDEVRQELSFQEVDEGLVIAESIEKFRELKLRLLNGTHAFSCGLAFLAGFKTVKEAMQDSLMTSFMKNLAMNEIAVAISNGEISYDEACTFAGKVMDRFQNPFIDHQWLNISVQYSSKMKMRNIPLLQQHYKKYSYAPEYMALGFAGYLLFMRCRKNGNGKYEGQWLDNNYSVEDDFAANLSDRWEDSNVDELVDQICADKEFWGADLSLLNGFADTVKNDLHSLLENGVMNTIRKLLPNKTVVSS